jgi:hypothetical protein
MLNIQYLEVGETRFPLAFTMNVMKAVQKKFGNINKISEMTKNGAEPDFEALIFFLREAINEGIDIENEKSTEPRPFLTEKQVGRVLSEAGIAKAFESIGKTISANVPNSDPKNAKPTESPNQ